jgi:hypothetical protein
MAFSNFSPPDKSKRDRPERHFSASPAYLTERSFLQWNILDSLGNAVVGWFLICTWLFWRDPVAEAFSWSGVTFIILGLVFFANIFGVLLYKTNQVIMIWQKKVHPPFPEIKHLKKLGWIANGVWFVIMFLSSQHIFDLTYDTLRSLYLS